MVRLLEKNEFSLFNLYLQMSNLHTRSSFIIELIEVITYTSNSFKPNQEEYYVTHIDLYIPAINGL